NVTADTEEEVALEVKNDTIILNENNESEKIIILNEDIDLTDVEIKTEDTDVIELDDYTVTGMKTGVAKITISYGKVSKDILVFVNKANDQKLLHPMINIEDRDSNLTINEDNTISIIRKGDNDLWGSDNTLNNLITFNTEQLNKDKFTGIVTLDNLPQRSNNNWDSVYFLIMKENEDATVNRDHYISIGKRAHSDGFAYTRELNGQGEEFSTGQIA